MSPFTVTLRNDHYLLNPQRWVLPYMGYAGMCGPKGYGFALFWSEIY